jgi:hypothetical protein
MKKTAEFISIQGRNLRTPPIIPRRPSSISQTWTLQETTKCLKSANLVFPISKRKLSRNNSMHQSKPFSSSIKKNPVLYEYEDPPSTPSKSANNERIFWKKRKLGSLPLLVIIFEGVMGNYSKSCLWSEERPSFNIRDHMSQGLEKLRSHFYCVLISTYSRSTSRDLVNFMESRTNHFDAIYMLRNRVSRPRHVHDISSILKEFGVVENSSVMAVSAIGIERNEILDRKGPEMIFEKATSAQKKYLTYFAPICDKESPLTILISHFSFLNKYQTFLDLAEFLIRVKGVDLNFFRGFEKLAGYIKLKTQFETDSDNTKILMSSHRFIFFTKENTRMIKPSTTEIKMKRPRRIVL